MTSILCKQIGLVLIAALAMAPLASAKTTKKTTHKATVAKSSKSSTKSHKTSKVAYRGSKSRHGKKTYARKSSWKSHGQQAMSSDRTREIQEALIRAHYLDGQANGVWDSRTQDACRRLQAENGWQTKVLPDSRALIKLGLGPDHSELLNPETAMTSPYAPGGGEKLSAPAPSPSPAASILPAAAVVR